MNLREQEEFVDKAARGFLEAVEAGRFDAAERAMAVTFEIYAMPVEENTTNNKEDA